MQTELVVGSNEEIVQFDSRWLKNTYPVLISFDGDKYKSVDEAFYAAQTPIRNERKYLKELGYCNKLTIRGDWEDVKIEIMEQFLIQKFTKPRFKRWLIFTKDLPIEFRNKECEHFWGKCFCYTCKGIGENYLGEMIMNIRYSFQEDIENKGIVVYAK